ncbi:MAG: efflux RND transporter permease subunit [Desulfobacteraceae bacterium]|nr:efflux RND transporter permease subunit [Desulfobacteraceae bacterium]MBC2755966.1 efflux RND transporter permease subunit [Desulfobacteraceae bacterium]
MIDYIIEKAIKERLIIIICLLCVIGYGIFQYNRLPVEAFPDVSPVMVPVFAEAHGMAPEEVERLITFPIETAMNGLPGVTQIKSTSAFGLAAVYVYFNDDTDIYFARQIVAERLSSAMADLPEMHEPPGLGPISSGLGQIFIYYLTIDGSADTDGKDPDTYLREINDWIVKFQLQSIPGVTDILSIGGHILQYQVKINPDQMNQFQIGLDELVDTIQKNNKNAGGQFLTLNHEEYLVRGIGLLQNLDDIRNLHIKVVNGTPVRIKDIADISFGKEIRRGIVTRNGEKEVVSGIVMQLFGENTSDVIQRLYKKIPEVQASLPSGIHLVPFYEQAELVAEATDTVKKALIYGAVLVIFSLFLFLGNLRTALIVALALPLCVLIAVIFMGFKGLSANLMSLGGIAVGIGMLGDGAIVMVENIFRHLSEPQNRGRNKINIILQAAKEVGRPIVFSIAIIVIVFMPIFTLQQVEGKMFSPMAFTITFALIGSILAALVMAPVLSVYILKPRKGQEFIVLRFLKKLYRPALIKAIDHKIFVLLVTVIIFVGSLMLVPRLGTEFIPTLEEGSILIGVTMAPSISMDKGKEIVMKLERKIMAYDEVEETVSRIGRPEAGSHPHPVNYAEVHIELKPLHEWNNYTNKAQLISALEKSLKEYPGIQLNFTQPIQNAFDELLSGVKSQLAIKLFGDDLNILKTKADEIKSAIIDIPGLVDLSAEQSFGQPQIQIIADRDACSRYGVNVSEILEIVELAIGGEVVDQIYLNNRRFGIHVRFQEQFRVDPSAISNLLIRTEKQQLIPLSQVAEIKKVIGPLQINREENQRRWMIQANVRGRDMGSVVSDIQRLISENVSLPPGYFIDYGGQFENQQRAMKRLNIIVPIAILLIFLMLYMAFDDFRNSLLIIINVPLSLIGGIIGLYVCGEYLSVPASVGFIALFGIAVQNGVVLVSYIKQEREHGVDLREALVNGGLLRLRPVLMTAFTTIVGLIPLLLSTGIGSEVQRPLAIVVVFGLISSTFLTLFLIPAMYGWFENEDKIKSVQARYYEKLGEST